MDFTYEPVGTIFTWVLLSLTAFRLTRLVTTDDLTDFFRRAVSTRFGPNSNWAMLVTCNWCAGAYVTAAVFAFASLTMSVPLPVYQTFAAWAVVGYLGNFDE